MKITLHYLAIHSSISCLDGVKIESEFPLTEEKVKTLMQYLHPEIKIKNIKISKEGEVADMEAQAISCVRL